MNPDEAVRFPVPESTTLARLVLGGRTVAEYRDGNGMDPRLAPRPYLHPVRTLAGTVVTDAFPADHPWHLGVGVAVQDVGGVNLWGGRTYRRGEGYVWLPDHGRIEHTGLEQPRDAVLAAGLRWLGPDGRPLLTEHRELRAEPFPAVGGAWLLRFGVELRNVSGAPLCLGSPATNGRERAGYGGFFWRLPSLSQARVQSADAAGEEAVHARTAGWLAVQGRTGAQEAEVTVVFGAADRRTGEDPWFVRLEGYPGVGSSLAAQRPVALAVDGLLRRQFAVLVVDGRPDLPPLARSFEQALGHRATAGSAQGRT